MLKNIIAEFLSYGNVTGFSKRSLQTLTSRLRSFHAFLQGQSIVTPPGITYKHLHSYVVDFGTPSDHVKKSRVWTIRQFFHFLKQKEYIQDNIARALPYPKIFKKVPHFLSAPELNAIVDYFVCQLNTPLGFRNLLIALFLSCHGLRVSPVVALNIEDVDLLSGTVRIVDKGKQHRRLVLPTVMCHLLEHYLISLPSCTKGALFMTVRQRRISSRTVQNLLKTAADDTRCDTHLHPHLFRHSAATQLNKVAGLTITSEVLGHHHKKNTEHYAHLNPDQYGQYMRRHPYMNAFDHLSEGGSHDCSH